jgi:hypothetical protein
VTISRTTPKPARCNPVRQPDRAIDRRLAPAVSFWAVESFGSPHGKGRTTKALGVFLPYTCFRQFRGRETEPGMTCRLILSGDGRNIVVFSPRPQNLPHTCRAPSTGTPVATVVRWGGDGASGAGQRNPRPGRFRPRVPLPPLRAVRAGRAHSPEANAPGGSQPHKAKSIRAERNGRKQKSPDGRPEGRITYLDERPSGRPSSRSLCRKADEISSLKWPDCESRAWRRWDACIRPKAASPPDGATGASRLMRAS